MLGKGGMDLWERWGLDVSNIRILLAAVEEICCVLVSAVGVEVFKL